MAIARVFDVWLPVSKDRWIEAWPPEITIEQVLEAAKVKHPRTRLLIREVTVGSWHVSGQSDAYYQGRDAKALNERGEVVYG